MMLETLYSLFLNRQPQVLCLWQLCNVLQFWFYVLVSISFGQQHIALTILDSIFNVDDNDDDDNNNRKDDDANVSIWFYFHCMLDDQMYTVAYEMCETKYETLPLVWEKGKTSFQCYLVKMEFTLNS